jgi:hypothetical protein
MGIVFGVLLMFMALACLQTVSACEPPPPPPPPPKWKSDLIAGQVYVAGYVEAWDDGTYLYIKYVKGSGWTIGETHVWVGDTIDPNEWDLPVTKKGNLKCGHFPYKNVMSLKIALKDIGDGTFALGDTIYIIAHAVVTGPDCQQETAYADKGNQVPGVNNWALYFPFTVMVGNA